jgi:hypothetical protein
MSNFKFSIMNPISTNRKGLLFEVLEKEKMAPLTLSHTALRLICQIKLGLISTRPTSWGSL